MAVVPRGAAIDAVDVDWRDLEKIGEALVQWSAVTRRPMGELLREEMGLVIQRLMQAMPPFVSFLQTSFAGQAKVGKAAVSRDIGKVYFSASAFFGELRARADEGLARRWYGAFSRGQYGVAAAMLTRAKAPDVGRIARTEMGGELNREHHRRWRDRRGRVNTRVPQQVVTKQARARYIREKQKMVMFAKAGWLPAANRFGSKGIPQAVRKHGGTAPGAALDFGSRAVNPEVIAKNFVSYAGRLVREGNLVRRVLVTREEVILRKVAALVEKGWKPKGGRR